MVITFLLQLVQEIQTLLLKTFRIITHLLILELCTQEKPLKVQRNRCSVILLHMRTYRTLILFFITRTSIRAKETTLFCTKTIERLPESIWS